MSSLSHLDEHGKARMVDVGEKPVSRRKAVSRGRVFMKNKTLDLILSGGMPKGDVFAAARIAGIMAAKKTHELIPLCHPIPISHCSVDFKVYRPDGAEGNAGDVPESHEKRGEIESGSDAVETVECGAHEYGVDEHSAVEQSAVQSDASDAAREDAVIEIEACVRTVGQTGAEMEAMTAVAVAGLTIYDMVKGVDRGVRLSDIRLVEKSGGKSGHYIAPERDAQLPPYGKGEEKSERYMAWELPPFEEKAPVGSRDASNLTKPMSGVRVGIVTASDKGSRGEREDKSGPEIAAMMHERGAEIISSVIVPDEKDQLVRALVSLSDESGCDLIFTTGGTGLGPRDVTPEATLEVIDRPVPGISERMRFESWRKTPHGMLSRAVAGVRKKSIIINLPGSPRAVRECLESIIDALPHAVEVVRGAAVECAQQRDQSGIKAL